MPYPGTATFMPGSSNRSSTRDDVRGEKSCAAPPLGSAARPPSGGNLRPWRVWALTGDPLAELNKLKSERLAAGDGPDDPEYPVCPPKLHSPYRERRFRNGEQL